MKTYPVFRLAIHLQEKSLLEATLEAIKTGAYRRHAGYGSCRNYLFHQRDERTRKTRNENLVRQSSNAPAEYAAIRNFIE